MIQARASFSTFISKWYAVGLDSTITVSAGGTQSNINIQLAAGGAIAGRVTAQGTNTGLEGAEVFARHTVTNEFFSEFTGPNGDYRIEAGLEGGLRPGAWKVWTADYTTAKLAYVPVELARFTASAGSGEVTLAWTTTEAGEAVGFHVHRAGPGEEEPVRLTTTLIGGGPDYVWVDRSVEDGVPYRYWITGVDRGGVESQFGPVAVTPGVAPETRLMAPSPNPVRSSSVIRFALARPGPVRLHIHDSSGRLVRTLADGLFPMGTAAITWDGRSDAGRPVAGGVYYLSLRTPDETLGGKVLVAR
jgi:hypothetical protein